jgi:molybdopterin-guanine dinucleotide biosynthesis protein
MKPVDKLGASRQYDDEFEALISQLRWQAYKGDVAPIVVARDLNFSATLSPQEIMARLRQIKCNFHAIAANAAELISKGVALRLGFNQKADYVSAHGTMYAETIEAADEMEAQVHAVVADSIISDPMFRMYWQFHAGKGDIRTAVVEERADDVLLDEAYPTLGGIQDYVHRYINADETVLVVIGPPGTGKTRLIRYILGEMARLRVPAPGCAESDPMDAGPGFARVRPGRPDWGEHHRVSAMYANDENVIKQGKLFVDFMTGDANALIIEDADHLLRSRQGAGNDAMHYFLAAADGVMRAQGRKIIFSSNLPNLTDVDDALMRPGRCHDVVHLRGFSEAEANRFAFALTGEKYPADPKKREHTVAEIYRWSKTLPVKPKLVEAA